MTNPLAGGPEDAPRKPDDPQPSPHGRDLTQLPRVGRRGGGVTSVHAPDSEASGTRTGRGTGHFRWEAYKAS